MRLTLRRSGFLALLKGIRITAFTVMVATHGLCIGSLVVLIVNGNLPAGLGGMAGFLVYAVWFGHDNETLFNNALECFYSGRFRLAIFIVNLAAIAYGSYGVLVDWSTSRGADKHRLQVRIQASAKDTEVIRQGVEETQRELVALRISLASIAEVPIADDALAGAEAVTRTSEEALETAKKGIPRVERTLRALEPDVAQVPWEVGVVPRESALIACQAVELQITTVQEMLRKLRLLVEAYRRVRTAHVSVQRLQEMMARERAAVDALEREAKDLLNLPEDRIDDVHLSRLERLTTTVSEKMKKMSLAESAAPLRTELKLGDLPVPLGLQREVDDVVRVGPTDVPKDWAALVSRLDELRSSLVYRSRTEHASYHSELKRCLEDLRTTNGEMQTWLEAFHGYASSLNEVAVLQRALAAIPGLPLDQQAEAVTRTVPGLQKFDAVYRQLQWDWRWGVSWRVDDAQGCARQLMFFRGGVRSRLDASGTEAKGKEILAMLRLSERLRGEVRSAEEARRRAPPFYEKERPALDDLLGRILLELEKGADGADREAEATRVVATPALEAGRELETEVNLETTARALSAIEAGTPWGAWTNEPLLQAKGRILVRKREVLHSGNTARPAVQETVARLRALIDLVDAWSKMSQAFERGWSGRNLRFAHNNKGETVPLDTMRQRIVSMYKAAEALQDDHLGTREKRMCEAADAKVAAIEKALLHERKKFVAVLVCGSLIVTATIWLLAMWMRRYLRRVQLRKVEDLAKYEQLPKLLGFVLNSKEKLFVREEAISLIGARGLRTAYDRKALLDAFDTLTERGNDRVEQRVRSAIHRVLVQMDRRIARDA